MSIINLIEKEVKEKIREYKENSEDNYDFWNEHIKYVYEESKLLAQRYNANIEIVSLGALLHDIALICQVGNRENHHINGEIIAKNILEKYKYPNDKKQKVLKCVYNHRSPKNATSIEELCVADADILAHFDNIPMLFNLAFNKYKLRLNEVRPWLKNSFEKEYEDLSLKTKEWFCERYECIKQIVLTE